MAEELQREQPLGEPAMRQVTAYSFTPLRTHFTNSGGPALIKPP